MTSCIKKPLEHYSFIPKENEEENIILINKENFGKIYFARPNTEILIYGLYEHSYESTENSFSDLGTESSGSISFEKVLLEPPCYISNVSCNMDYEGGSHSCTYSEEYKGAIIVENPIANNPYPIVLAVDIYDVKDHYTSNKTGVCFCAFEVSFKPDDIKEYIIANEVRRFASIGITLPKNHSVFENFKDFESSFFDTRKSQYTYLYEYAWRSDVEGNYTETQYELPQEECGDAMFDTKVIDFREVLKSLLSEGNTRLRISMLRINRYETNLLE